MQKIGTILKSFDPTRDKYISREFQSFGIYLAEELNDWKHKALYIRLAKKHPRAVLEKALSFVKDAVIPVANSGKDVPTATIVRPIMNSLMPKRFAILAAESTSRSAPFTNNAMPKPKITASRSMLLPKKEQCLKI